MRKDKQKAIALRKDGNSYKQISDQLKIPKSTLSCWLKDLKISAEAQQKINKRAYKKSVDALIERNINQTVLAKERADKIKREAEAEVTKFIGDPLFITGVALYWAEGYKKGDQGSHYKSVDFTNSDSEMIKLMMKFFRKYFDIDEDRFKVQLMAHPNISVEDTVKYWSKITKLNISNFTKTTVLVSKASKGKRSINCLENGTVHLRIFDVKLFYRMIGWINGLKKI